MMLVLLPLVCSDALLLLIPLPPSPTRGEPALCPLIPPAPFSHKGRRGSLGVLMAETGDGMQGPAKKPADVSFLSASLFRVQEKVDVQCLDAQNERRNAEDVQKIMLWQAAIGTYRLHSAGLIVDECNCVCSF